MLRLQDYHGVCSSSRHGGFQGAKSRRKSHRGSHFRRQKQITSNDHNYFKTLPSEPAIELSLPADEKDACVETETE